MALKTITLHGWWVSFERDSDVYLKHEEVSGFSSIEKIEVDGIETPYKEYDFISVEFGRIITEYPTKYTPGLRRCKSDKSFTIKINAREFDPRKLQLHYADVVIKIGAEEIDTGNKIVRDITYNGRKCHLKWKSNANREYQTVIWYKSPFIYDFLDFNDGLAAAELNEKCGYIDSSGRVVISFQYDRTEEFRNGFAPICLRGDGWGFVDKTGKEVIPCKYDEVHHFFDGRAFICEKGN
ncbi:MAG: WG repeat-containing protein, partial [Alistipes sp.]|nr:WG repeat-containing protein [Alistipes sp.]